MKVLESVSYAAAEYFLMTVTLKQQKDTATTAA